MNIFSRALIVTIPLLCAAGVMAAPVGADHGGGAAIAPVCSGGQTPTVPAPPPERHDAAGPMTPSPAPVPVRITVHDLTSAPHVAADRSGPVEVEIVLRGERAGGSATALPAALRDLVGALLAQQRVQAPRPHR
ncbi:hypothetical protein [Nocardia rhizosphaerae]|uniref:Secreted protein n=1 Tax=Nocardia rhizosphaerae TaxID=1691571 RepID=A0ABV8L711_9NOCA